MLNNHSKNRRIASGGDSTIRRLLQKSQLSKLKNRQIIVQIIVQKSPTLTTTNASAYMLPNPALIRWSPDMESGGIVYL